MRIIHSLAMAVCALALTACATAPPEVPDRTSLDARTAAAAGEPGTPPGEVRTLEEAIVTALHRNPGLRAEYARVEVLLQDVPQVTSLADPMLSISHQEAVRGPGDERENMLTLSQTFPWFGKRELRGRIARQDVLAAVEDYRVAALELRRDVIRAWHQLRYEEDFRALLLEEQALLNEVLSATTALYRTGQRDRGALLRAQTDLAIVENELPASDAAIEARRRELGRLMALPGGVYTHPAAAPVHSPQLPEEAGALVSLAMEHRPELAGYQRAIEAARLRRELGRLDYYPDFTLGLGVTGMGPRGGDYHAPASDSRTDSLSASAGINIPIPNARRRAVQEQARLQEQESVLRRDEAANAILAEIHSLRADAAALQRRMHLYEAEIIPLAGEAHRAAEAAYRSGRSTYVDLLDAQRTLIMARREAVRLDRDHRLALADLERAAGMPLDLPALDEVTER